MTEAFAPTTDEVARAVDLQSEPLLAERVRTALLIALMSLPVFLVQDLLCFPDRRGALTAIKLVQVGILGVFLWLFRKGRKQRHAVAIALLASVVLAFVTSVAGAVRENTSTTPLVFIVVTICTAVGFPWGARTQAAFAIICSVLIGWNYFVVDGSLRPALSSPSAAAAVSAGFVSIFVAHAFERYRWQIHERELGLRQREEHFRALIENGGDLIIITAADSSVRYVSGSFHRLVGLRPETWSNIPLVDLVHPDDAELLRRALSEQKGGAPRSVEIRVRDSRSRWRVLEATVANALGHPAVRGIIVNARDVTSRKEMENELRDTTELARRNQADLTHVLRLGTMGEIASGLAHEINQPLASISNFAGACGRMLESGDYDALEIRHGLGLISSEALRAGEIIRRLRDLGRRCDGRVEPIDVNEVVRRASDLISPEVRLQGISLSIDAASRLPSVFADPVQIEQVLLNLMLNGIDAVQSSSQKCLTVQTASAGGEVYVSVCDSGTGVQPELAERVFEPFFTTKSKGLGMGLAISRRIIEAHGGHLRAATNPGGAGSTFSFSLPVA